MPQPSKQSWLYVDVVGSLSGRVFAMGKGNRLICVYRDLLAGGWRSFKMSLASQFLVHKDS